MRAAYLSLFMLALLLLTFSATAGAMDSIGIIKSVSGEVYLASTETSIKAVPHMKISQGDLIRTGPNSNVGLIFEDDTVVSLGSNSELCIEQFLFDPAAGKLAFITKLFRGTFSFISGQIAKLAPDQVRLETPDATLGVRGTKFLVKID
ncbi:FecR domain-containing protein [Desulforhopalus sp. IMCC35007]|uniref:FecR family protein n=1 Tax=Desulforhopalus sp. IMCC35007 TaxID=2569543 RepID=UPI00145D1D41|nr:FecR domain-containing protein [Desulforhopalus sp. IMCC35007]